MRACLGRICNYEDKPHLSSHKLFCHSAPRLGHGLIFLGGAGHHSGPAPDSVNPGSPSPVQIALTTLQVSRKTLENAKCLNNKSFIINYLHIYTTLRHFIYIHVYKKSKEENTLYVSTAKRSVEVSTNDLSVNKNNILEKFTCVYEVSTKCRSVVKNKELLKKTGKILPKQINRKRSRFFKIEQLHAAGDLSQPNFQKITNFSDSFNSGISIFAVLDKVIGIFFILLILNLT